MLLARHGDMYTGLKRAAELVSLSQISEEWTVEAKNRVIETLDNRQACREAHPGLSSFIRVNGTGRLGL